MAGNVNVGSIGVRLSLDASQLQQGLAKATSNLSRFGDEATKMGKSLTMKLTAPLAGVGIAAVKTATQFEASLGKISGLVGVAASEVAQMGEVARSMSVDFGKGAGEAADALFYITSAGLRGADAMAVLEQSMKASAIGLGSTATVADLATSAVNAYGIANLSAANATDTLVATVREGKLAPEELAGSMGRVLPLASAMGVRFEEVGAAFAALSRTGTNAAEAATQIRGILASLLRPTKGAEDALSGMGLSAEGLRTKIEQDGLLSTLELLAEKFDGNEAASAAVFGNIRALSGVLDLMGSNVETTRQIFANMESNLGDTDKALSAFSGTAQFQMSVAMAKVKDALLSLGQAIMPVLLPILETLSNAVKKVGDFFQRLPAPVKTFVVVLGAVAMAAGPVLLALGAMAKAFAAVGTAALIAGGAQTGAGVGAFTMGLSKMLPLLKSPYFWGAAAVVGGIAIAYKALSSSAKEARERQERLTEQLRAANDPTVTLIDKVKQLAEAYKTASAEAEAFANVGGSVEEAFVATEFASKGLDTALASTGINMGELTSLLETGTDAFDNLRTQLQNGGVDAYAASLERAVASGVPFAQSLLDAYEAGKIGSNQLLQIVELLDRTADAFDDNREAINANAQELLFNAGPAYERYAALLGADFFIALRDTSIATYEAAGSQTAFADALKVVEGYARRVEVTTSGMGSRVGYTGDEATSTAKRMETLDDVLRRLRNSTEEGTASFGQLAQELGIVGDVLANEIQLAFLDAQDAAVQLFDDLADGETSFSDVERAVRETAVQIGELVVNTTNLGGKTSDAIPSIVKIMRALYDGAEAAGVSSDKVKQLIDDVGFLDSLSPEIALALTLDTTAIEAQIQTLVTQLQAMGGRSGAIMEQIDQLGRLAKMIRDVERQRDSGGGGTGGGGGQPDNSFGWVTSWVSSVANTANQLISRDFGKMLVEGSADDVRDALANLLEVAADLGITGLPGFDALLASVTAQFEKLAATAERRGLLTEEIADATDALKTLQRQIEDIRDAQEDWLVSTKQKSPTLSLIEQALEAQREYDRLYSNAEELRGQRQAFVGEVAATVTAPLQAGKSALGQTSRVLADARKFRDNILALRERGFGGDVLREVVNAGVVDGNRIAKSLLSMSEADMATFAQMRQEIAAIGAETGAVVADVVFGADVSEAERKLDEQRSIVNQLFANALAEAEKNAKRQEVVVGKLNDKLAGTEAAIRDLTHAIQVDLYNTFFGFLSGFQNGLDQLGQAPVRIPALASGGIVTQPTVALVGEAGAEAVVPLDRMGPMGGGDVYVTLVVEGSVTSERDLVETVRKGLLAAQKSGRQVLL